MNKVSRPSISNTIATLVVVLLLASCGTTQPSKYYMLTPITNEKTLSSGNQTGYINIGLGPIQLPGYLDRAPLVVRGTGSEVIINDLHRWAEPLEDNFSRIVAENLYALLDDTKISLHPWRDQRDINYQVTITVFQFDTDINGSIVLSSNWSLLDARNDQLLYTQRSIINEKADANSYPALVEAQSKAAEKLTRDIAGKLEELIGRRQQEGALSSTQEENRENTQP